MAAKRGVKAAPTDPFLVAELRQIEADQKAARDEANADFRAEWAAKMAAEPARPAIHRSALRPAGSAR